LIKQALFAQYLSLSPLFMKNHLKFYRYYLALFLPFLISCEKDPASLPQPQADFIVENAQVFSFFDDVDNLALFVSQNNGLGLRTNSYLNGDLCSNTIISVNENSKTIVVNFGNGCTSPNGISRKGKIVMAFNGLFLVKGSFINVTFDGYEVNGKKIEGIRRITNQGFENSESTFEVRITNGKITWPDNSFTTFDGAFVKKYKVTLDPLSISMAVTGQATGRHRLGTSYTAAIQNALSYLNECTKTGIWVASSGVLQLVSGEEVFNLDFGSGACDKEVEVTHKGNKYFLKLD
jgi:hypothetical protein